MNKVSPKTALGQAFLNKASVIFLSLILLTILSTASAVYAEYKTGELTKIVLEPAKKFFSEVAKSFETTPPPEGLTDPESIVATGSATVEFKTNIKTNTGSNSKTTTTTITYPKATSVPINTKSYEESVAEMNAKADQKYQEALKAQEAWSKQKQAENQAWFNEQSAKNEATSKTWYDQKVQESQQALEQWKKEHGF